MSQESKDGGRKMNLPKISGQQIRQWLLIGLAVAAIVIIGITMSSNEAPADAEERQIVVQEQQLTAPDDNQDAGQTVAPDHTETPDSADGLSDVGNVGGDPLSFE